MGDAAVVVLRLNLFGAWMVVLIAEATGVGYGLGQVIMFLLRGHDDLFRVSFTEQVGFGDRLDIDSVHAGWRGSGDLLGLRDNGFIHC